MVEQLRARSAAAGRAARASSSARFDAAEVDATRSPSCSACARIGEIDGEAGRRLPKIIPLRPVPLQTLVVNVTNQCNLACTYCYEYGEDKIVDTENGQQPKFMSEETARESVEFALRESRENKHAHITFFGGETLMNFPVLKSTIAYARRTRRRSRARTIDFSLTTNATLLQPDVIEFLADERVGVTISIDGPEEMQDKFRVFNNGQGSYDMAAPKIKALLARHTHAADRRARHADRQTLDVQRIYQPPHRRHGLLGSRLRAGDHRAAAATTRSADGGFDHLLEQFRALAADYLAGVAAEPAPRLLERPRDAAGDSPRPRQGVSVRRRHRPDGRVHRRPRRAVPPLRRLRRRTASAR